MLVGPHNGAVDEDFLEVGIDSKLGKYRMPHLLRSSVATWSGWNIAPGFAFNDPSGRLQGLPFKFRPSTRRVAYSDIRVPRQTIPENVRKLQSAAIRFA
jgi:hypothetical protein